MLLKDFNPKSELIVNETEISLPKFSVIDCHCHLGHFGISDELFNSYDIDYEIKRIKDSGVNHIISPDIAYGTSLEKILKKTEKYDDFITTYGGLDVQKCEQPNFEEYVYKTIKNYKANGIKGLKFWKTFGVEFKYANDEYYLPSDKIFDCIWQYASEFNLPVMYHFGDPTAFFKPINFDNERIEELGIHPEWSFYGKKRFSFEQLMTAQEYIIKNNPKTLFIIPHVGSKSEDLNFVGDQLDKYDNMIVDITERIGELGRQPYTSRKFFTKYQDRILFGTDHFAQKTNMYHIYYRFLETFDEYFDYSAYDLPPQGRWKIYGIGLDDIVLEKIYNRNAMRLNIL